MKKPVIPVSDHAVIRYMERVLEIDVEQVRDEIRAKVKLSLVHPAATGILVDGFRYVLADGAVVTIIDAYQPQPRVAGEQSDDD